jgi:hypothetical protein
MNRRVRCLCACGKEKLIARSSLLTGRSRSCGCGRRPFKHTYEVGQVIGNLKILEVTRKTLRLECLGCGTQASVLRKFFRSPKRKYQGVKDCGCNKEAHGHTRKGVRTPEHLSWGSMINRSRNPRKATYVGVKVCSRWEPRKGGSFANFFADLGWRPPEMTLDRIDPNGHYTCGKCDECKANGWPMNCRWATWSEQGFNRRPYMRMINGKPQPWTPRRHA